MPLLHHAHTEFARLNGASDAEIGEAVAMAAITRHWSTYLNGIQTDETKFRGEIAKLAENVKKAIGDMGAAPAPATVVDGKRAAERRRAVSASRPSSCSVSPRRARAGAWGRCRDVQLNPATALSGKQKELVGLAVASQSLPLLHHRAHRVREAERRHRRGNQRRRSRWPRSRAT